jgi:hypothetical protein
VTAVVHQVDPPPSTRTLSTLPRIDYCDAFLFDAGSTHGESAEDLVHVRVVRDILGQASQRLRT